MLHTHMLVQNRLKYVERRLSRLCGGHGELPHEVYLMEGGDYFTERSGAERNRTERNYGLKYRTELV